jgi:ADP-ribose pyrophosphatase YjhB (NUDIX family)
VARLVLYAAPEYNADVHDVEKVQAYHTRETDGGRELLVFRQITQPYELVEVPGGTVEPGEDPDLAVLREVLEESGLTVRIIRKLASVERAAPKHIELRHCYHVATDHELPDTWLHTVTGGGEDCDMVFSYFWLPVAQAKRQLDWMGQWLDLLDARDIEAEEQASETS